MGNLFTAFLFLVISSVNTIACVMSIQENNYLYAGVHCFLAMGTFISTLSMVNEMD